MLTRLFPNRFWKPGFIGDNVHVHGYSSLLNIVLHDQQSLREISLISRSGTAMRPSILIPHKRAILTRSPLSRGVALTIS